MIVALIADTHFGVRNDSLPMQQAMQKFYEHVFFPTLDAYDVRRVLHAGDYLDRRKFTNTATARFVYDTYRTPLETRAIQEDVVVGNHDIYYRHSTELTGVEEFYRDAKRVRIHKMPTEIDVDGLGILMLPWITDNTQAAAQTLLQSTRCSVILGHLEIAGYQMHRGIANSEGLNASMFDRFRLVLSGHYHHRTVTDPIVYLGAPYPMIWSDYNDPRGFHLFDTDTCALTFIENPYSLFCRIVYDDQDKRHDYVKALVQDIMTGYPNECRYTNAYVKIVVRSKVQPYWFDLVLDALNKVNAADVVIVDDITLDDTEEQDPTSESPTIDTLSLMREYVDSLTISCDKDALFLYLRQKYEDAINANESARLS